MNSAYVYCINVFRRVSVVENKFHHPPNPYSFRDESDKSNREKLWHCYTTPPEYKTWLIWVVHKQSALCWWLFPAQLDLLSCGTPESSRANQCLSPKALVFWFAEQYLGSDLWLKQTYDPSMKRTYRKFHGQDL